MFFLCGNREVRGVRNVFLTLILSNTTCHIKSFQVYAIIPVVFLATNFVMLLRLY